MYPFSWTNAPLGYVHSRLRTPVLRHWKNEHRFPNLKAVSRELLGMTATSVPWERVFSHGVEMYRAKRVVLGVLILAILMLMTMRMNPHLGMN